MWATLMMEFGTPHFQKSLFYLPWGTLAPAILSFYFVYLQVTYPERGCFPPTPSVLRVGLTGPGDRRASSPEACSPAMLGGDTAGSARITKYEIHINVLFSRDLNFKSGPDWIQVDYSPSPRACQSTPGAPPTVHQPLWHPAAFSGDPRASRWGAEGFAPRRAGKHTPGLSLPWVSTPAFHPKISSGCGVFSSFIEV